MLKKKSSVWLKVNGTWLKINPYHPPDSKPDRKLIKIQKLEAALAKLKGGHPTPKKASGQRKLWDMMTPEQRAERLRKLKEGKVRHGKNSIVKEAEAIVGVTGGA